MKLINNAGWLIILLLLNVRLLNAQWSKISLGTTNDLYDLNFTTHGQGYIAGQGTTIFKTKDSGVSWIKIAPGFSNNLRGILFKDTGTGFTFGENGNIYKTNNSAKTWNLKFSFIGSYLYNAAFYDSAIVAVGQRGLIASSRNTGEKWVTDTVATKRSFYSVVFASGKFWAVGDSGAIYSRTLQRNKWINISYPTNIRLNNIQSLNDSVLIITGGMADTTSVGKFFNIVLFSEDSGKNWEQATIAEAKQINSAWHFNVDEGYLVGTTGLIVKSLNKGTINGRQSTNTSNSINDIVFLNGKSGFCAGDGGLLLKTKNTGGFGTDVKSVFTNNYYQLYPNPILQGDDFIVELSNEVESLQITDMQGRLIYNNNYMVNNKLTFSGYNAGVYNVSAILISGKISTSRLFVF
ncbi:MAG: T9SS type A sorting domain-containing protein [Bacteroidia bacterium]|nr:T9SS type A sorting domain-containing protein [Bacteroidia bacterium]